MMSSWLRSAMILAVLLVTLTGCSSVSTGGDVVASSVPLDGKIPTAAGGDSIDSNEMEMALNNLPDRQLESSSRVDAVDPSKIGIRSDESKPALRGSARRRLDLEDMLQEMSTKDPSQWDAAEWLVMILFLSLISWLGCCILRLCCCGGGAFGDVLRCLCCYELCCRGGADIDECCNYYG
ncbi:hypothetical protein ACHAWF_010813 [Thalassiosira exigua]